ncbi:MAG: Ig-like domain-containing protein [Acidobacteriaceae bacterium]
MRITMWLIAGLTAVLTACSGGGGNTLPAAVPATTLQGSAYDAALNDSTVDVYSYENGVIGTQLAETTTAPDGSFSLNIQSESTPLLVVASGGYYVEEASGTTVNLTAGQTLQAVLNHTTGQADTVYLTPLTHLAAGLAAYRIKQGMSASAAIDSANQEISNIVGFNIVTTKPLDITDPANATAFPTYGDLYGFISAAISSWTAYASTKSGTPIHSVENTISFTQKLYEDVVADGKLDGVGVDQNGNISPVSLGLLPLNQTVYRYAIAAHIIAAVNSRYNKTGLTEAQVADFANKFATNDDAIWAGAPILPFATNHGRPVITFTSPRNGAWIARTTPVSGTVTDNVPIDSTQFTVDNALVGTAATPTSPVFSINTTGPGYPDGTHTFTLVATNSIGITNTASITVGVDNTPPTSTGTESDYAASDGVHLVWSVTPQDAGSGINTVYTTVNGTGTLLPFAQQSNGTWYFDVAESTLGLTNTSINVFTWPVVIKDNAGNCSSYDDSAGGVAGAGWRYLSGGPC